MLSIKHRRLRFGLIVLLPILMFGFSYLLVPFYYVLCSALGINGKVTPTSVHQTLSVDRSRQIDVQFLTTAARGIPWSFYPEHLKMKVHPNAKNQMVFIAKNLSNQPATVTAVVSVAPGRAAKYLKELRSLTGRSYTVGPHQSIRMPLQFYIDGHIPPRMTTVTVAYTLFEKKEP